MNRPDFVEATAPGKIILCGEHAVVYGQPAIALPVTSIGATVRIEVGAESANSSAIFIDLPDLEEQWLLTEQPNHPLADLISRTLHILNIRSAPALRITVRSTIPIASGMGSGAAIGAALVNALGAYFETPLAPAVVSALVYESERYFHGTPSGIDNTVVSYSRPIWYQRGAAGEQAIMQSLGLGAALTLVIGDTGVRCPTRITVGGVRQRFEADPATYQQRFTAIGELVQRIRIVAEQGDLLELGRLLDANHQLLQMIGVSSLELDRLVASARNAGALGAKLSGGGGGGIMIALTPENRIMAVKAALLAAGATRALVTHVAASGAQASLV